MFMHVNDKLCTYYVKLTETSSLIFSVLQEYGTKHKKICFVYCPGKADFLALLSNMFQVEDLGRYLNYFFTAGHEKSCLSHCLQYFCIN